MMQLNCSIQHLFAKKTQFDIICKCQACLLVYWFLIILPSPGQKTKLCPKVWKLPLINWPSNRSACPRWLSSMVAPGLKTGCSAPTCFRRMRRWRRGVPRVLASVACSFHHTTAWQSGEPSHFSAFVAPSYLSVIGQVVGTVHELLQRAARPVGALVAGRQLFGRRRASVAHVQRGFPRGTPLHMSPLAEVSRHRVP